MRWMLIVVVLLLLVGYVVVSQHKALIDGCGRGKVNAGQLSRVAQSRVQYLDRVLAADSVQSDVKRAAAAQRRAELAASRLFEARARIDCGDAFPWVAL